MTGSGHRKVVRSSRTWVLPGPWRGFLYHVESECHSWLVEADPDKTKARQYRSLLKSWARGVPRARCSANRQPGGFGYSTISITVDWLRTDREYAHCNDYLSAPLSAKHLDVWEVDLLATRPARKWLDPHGVQFLHAKYRETLISFTRMPPLNLP